MSSNSSLRRHEAAALHPAALRRAIADGRWMGPTIGMARGYVQANLAIVPERHASDFLEFCSLNSKACPILEVSAPGDPITSQLAEADIRTDLPRYRVFRHGRLVEEPTDIVSYWRRDLVAFLLGCSLTFEQALEDEGVPVRHLEAGTNCPVYTTTRACSPAGPFSGPLVVSMRPIPSHLVSMAIKVTERCPEGHGAPVSVGDPELLGIRDLARPTFGDRPAAQPGDVPVFWACGVTPQAAAVVAKLDLMITHAPAHMFASDRRFHLADAPERPNREEH